MVNVHSDLMFMDSGYLQKANEYFLTSNDQFASPNRDMYNQYSNSLKIQKRLHLPSMLKHSSIL
jgi:hypothetical protein